MIKYFKTKKMETEFKYALYSFIASALKEQKNIVDLIQRLYISLKDVPADELRSELITKVAELVHETNQKG